MYNKIINPINGKSVNINSKLGIKILNKYIIQSGGLRCDKLYDFDKVKPTVDVGNKYTIRSVVNVPYNSLASLPFRSLGMDKYTHYFINIITSNGCELKFGLKEVNGVGTEVTFPDSIQSVCTYKFNKCIEKRNNPETCKNQGCFGINTYKKINDGSDKYDINYLIHKDVDGTEMSGVLNQAQVNITNWLLNNYKKKVDEKKGRVTYIVDLPFKFYFTSDFCYGGNFTGIYSNSVFYNCKKFAHIFHKDPEILVQYLINKKRTEQVITNTEIESLKMHYPNLFTSLPQEQAIKEAKKREDEIQLKLEMGRMKENFNLI